MRNLRFAGCISVTIHKLPLTHVGNNVLDGEHGRALEPGKIRLRNLMATLQRGCYVGYGHLYFSSVNGIEKHTWLVALTPQIIIEFSDQALIGGGGNGLEKPLEAPVLQFLNGPTCCLIIGELLFDCKGVLQ
jgi:hypothetical protein